MRLALLVVVALAGSGCKPMAPVAPVGGAAFSVEPASYGENANAPAEVVEQCAFEQELAESVAETAGGSVGGDNPRVVRLKIIRVQGASPDWQGDRMAIVEGEFVDDGTVTGSFRIKRGAQSNVLGGIRGVCRGFDLVADDMAGEIASWMAAPSMNAEL